MNALRYSKVLALGLWLGAHLAACGGGRSGTGVTDDVAGTLADTLERAGKILEGRSARRLTFIEGNVADPGPIPSRVPAIAPFDGLDAEFDAIAGASSLDGVLVWIEGTVLSDATDESGYFAIEDQISGPIALRFARRGGGISAPLILVVPRNSHMTLSDVSVDASNGGIGAELIQVEFDAVVQSVDCAARELTVSSAAEPEGDSFGVDLLTSRIIGEGAAPDPCANLEPGDAVRIDGFFSPDGAIESGIIER